MTQINNFEYSNTEKLKLSDDVKNFPYEHRNQIIFF